MKAIRLFILTCILGEVGMVSMNAQTKQEKKKQAEQAVRQLIEAKDYKINVDRAIPMRGGSKNLTSSYSLKVRNDSVYSYLPYFGVAYSLPYGGGKGLLFDESLTDYKIEYTKKGAAKISFKSRNNEDSYTFNLTIFPDGTASIQVAPVNKQSISYSGDLDLSSFQSSE